MFGGSKIVDFCSIKQTPDGWTWARQEAKGQKPDTFLTGYLEKSMSAKNGVNYWLFGVQHWTASRSIRAKQETKEKKGGWILKGVKSLKDGFRACRRADSKGFFSGLLRKKEKSIKQATKAKPEKIDLSFRTASDLSYQC